MGSLLNSFKITKLDLEDNNLDNNRLDKTTTYTPNNSGTPTNQANPGKPTNFFQTFVPTNPYLDFVKNIPGKSNLLNLGKLPRRLTILENGVEVPLPAYKYSIFDATNLDIEKSGVDGGIPYKQQKDPTVYPTTTQKKSSTGGFYPVEGQAASKYDQVFSPKNTYLDFIKKYT